jgi:hypothetical protein
MDYYFRVGSTGTNTGAGNMSIANDDEYIMTFTPDGSVGLKAPVSDITNIFTIQKGGGSAIADGWATYSSRRWKTNIQPLTGALAKVERLSRKVGAPETGMENAARRSSSLLLSQSARITHQGAVE